MPRLAMRRYQSPFFLILLPLAVAVLGIVRSPGARDLPREQSDLFSGSGNCATCHTPDREDSPALRGQDGSDVSPPSFWRSTMMANASKDPYWKAKVSAEIAANPGLRAAIEDKCTKCHAPAGRTEAVRAGEPGYTLEALANDPLGKDGVTCTVCHQILPDNLGTEESFSGGYQIGENQTIFGPYSDPVGWPMLALSGYEPVYGAHMSSSALCATCHTLFTDAVNESGQVVGSLPEQTPYLEWLNSEYPRRDVQCQTCHMPVEPVPVRISNTPSSLASRSPFYRHEFVGGNAFMLTMLKNHGDELGVTAEPAHFDSTIARTRKMLSERSAQLDVRYQTVGDSVDLVVTIQNLSGHKLPTGYPSRRMWVDMEVVDGAGQSVFHSGSWDPTTGEVTGLDDEFEPHHEVIRTPGQVQVYQSVLGDPAGRVTFGLLRGSQYLKDNRILPAGWVSGGPWTQATAPQGRAGMDADYQGDGVQGAAGQDRVTYRIPAPQGTLYVYARLRYQSIAPRFADHLFGYQTPEVDAFQGMYQAADKRPELMDSVRVVLGPSVSTEPVSPRPSSGFAAYPNPATDLIRFSGAETGPILVFDMTGRMVRRITTGAHWDLKDRAGRRVPAGVYVVMTEPRRSTHPRKSTLAVVLGQD